MTSRPATTPPPTRPRNKDGGRERRAPSSACRLSLGANVVLLGFVAVLYFHRAPVTARLLAPSQPATAHASTIDAAATDAQLQPKPGGPQLTPTAVAELERLGISRDAIVNALIDDHTYRHDERVRTLQKKYAPRPVPRREMLALSREGEAERVRELKAALGEDGYRAWDKDNTLRMLNMGGVRLTPEEADKAYQLQKAFAEKNAALEMAKEDGITDETDFNALYEQAQRKLDQDLEALFGPDRLAALRGKPDPLADVTRRYQDLDPTPEQASAVMQAEGQAQSREAELLERLKDNPEDAAQVSAELKAISDARDDNLRQIFGAQNYDAAKLQDDSTYQKLHQYAGAWDLQEAQIQPVYDALRAFHEQADRTRAAAELNESAGQPVNWHQVNAGIEQARLQAELNLANLIGGERVRRLRQNGLLDAQ